MKDPEVFNADVEQLSKKQAEFVIKSLVAAGHVSQGIIERAIRLAETINA